jgi:hypothetical protein
MRQVLDHIYRAQMAHSCNDGDKLRVELESAAKLVEEKFTSTNKKSTPCPKFRCNWLCRCGFNMRCGAVSCLIERHGVHF